MINWYEEEIRRNETERELCHRRRINEAIKGQDRASQLDHALAWLGRGLVTWGAHLQRRANRD